MSVAVPPRDGYRMQDSELQFSHASAWLLLPDKQSAGATASYTNKLQLALRLPDIDQAAGSRASCCHR
eukprot:6157840-Pleurochrysis_carterae.AAC.1